MRKLEESCTVTFRSIILGSNGKFWKPRKNAVYQVGRLVSAHPAEGERYFLRVLLNHVAGATSYRDLRTVDGVLLPSFREAAERRGLIEEHNTLMSVLLKTVCSICHPHCVGYSRQYWYSASRMMCLGCGQNTLTQCHKTTGATIQTRVWWNRWF